MASTKTRVLDLYKITHHRGQVAARPYPSAKTMKYLLNFHGPYLTSLVTIMLAKKYHGTIWVIIASGRVPLSSIDLTTVLLFPVALLLHTLRASLCLAMSLLLGRAILRNKLLY